MDKPIDHETCSQLLPVLLSGELRAPEVAAVQAHVLTCEGCRAEKRVLELLRAADPGEPLSPTERSALERGVMAGIAEETGGRTVVPLPRRKPVGHRVAQVLGAAATIAVLATLVYFGAAGGGGEDSGVTVGRDQVAVEEESGELADQDRRGNAGGGGGSGGDEPLPGPKSDQAALGSKAADTAGGSAGPRPTFSVEDDPFTAGELQKRGESSLASVRFSNYYSTDAAAGRDAFLDQLVDGARTKASSEVAAQVERCGRQVLDTEDPTIPTFASIGRLDGTDVLVIGFAWSRSSSGALDRYMVWAWERGSCEVAVDFVEGRIETAN